MKRRGWEGDLWASCGSNMRCFSGLECWFRAVSTQKAWPQRKKFADATQRVLGLGQVPRAVPLLHGVCAWSHTQVVRLLPPTPVHPPRCHQRARPQTSAGSRRSLWSESCSKAVSSQLTPSLLSCKSSEAASSDHPLPSPRGPTFAQRSLCLQCPRLCAPCLHLVQFSAPVSFTHPCPLPRPSEFRSPGHPRTEASSTCLPQPALTTRRDAYFTHQGAPGCRAG